MQEPQLIVSRHAEQRAEERLEVRDKKQIESMFQNGFPARDTRPGRSGIYRIAKVPFQYSWAALVGKETRRGEIIIATVLLWSQHCPIQPI